AHGLAAAELAVVQVGLVHDLRDDPHAPVLDAEALDECLEGAILAVVSEIGPEDVERHALARGVRGIGEAELRVGVAEALDEPRRGDAVDVRARTGDPRASRWRQRRAVSSPPRARPLPAPPHRPAPPPPSLPARSPGRPSRRALPLPRAAARLSPSRSPPS